MDRTLYNVVAAQAAPGSVLALLLEASELLCSREARDFEAAGWIYARILRLPRSSHEDRHARAVGVAVDGDYAGARAMYDEILADHPCDALALGVAQVFDYYLGNAAAMRARSARALREWPRHLPGYSAVLSLHAFALQECGDYAAAEEVAQRALALQPRDVRAHHAVAHVMEMEGRFEEAIRWMGARSTLWSASGPASTHLWWHLALYHLELGRHAHALAIYDRRMQGEALSELIDGASLLWRLSLAGADVGGRFRRLAGRWSPYAADAHCAFNDLHAAMAFVGGGRADCAQRLLAALQRRVARVAGTNYDMTRLVGLPACRAIVAFGAGDYAAAEALLRALPPVAHRIGGSHAQRDVLQLTRAAARARLHSRHPRERGLLAAG